MGSLLVPDGSIDTYAVMGNPVAHSKSPQIHAAFARQTGQTLSYGRILVPLDDLAGILDEFQRQGGKGANITLPFKEEAFRLMQVRTARAEAAEAVNTIWFDEMGKRYGDTTDGVGLIRDLENLGISIAARRVLILGAGGAVRGVLGELLRCAPASLTIANRDQDKARRLVNPYSSGTTPVVVSSYQNIHGCFDLVINGTSGGLHGEAPPLPDDFDLGDADCYDMVYGDGPTPFLRWAGEHGAAQAWDGIGMLVEQAAESYSIWRGIRPDTAPVIAMLRADRHRGQDLPEG